MTKLAYTGGTPVLETPLSAYKSMGKAELDAVKTVVESGVLSKFLGGWCDEFFGGPAVREFESMWSTRFKVKHTVSVNSATSGLFAAMGAIGVEPGDEIIVPPYTMSATAMAPLVYGGIPIFADIEAETFCIDPAAVEAKITGRTKAILAVNLFGHPARLHELRRLADKHGIFLIEDNAQGPLADESGVYAGTIGHIGVFSLNYHKHIHTGEGGMCVTNDDRLAFRLQMIRNHAENIVDAVEIEDLANLVGFNYRLSEMSAAIGIAQLDDVDRHVARRERAAAFLSEQARGLEGVTPPVVQQDCRHVYYAWAFKYDEKVTAVPRQLFVDALAAEGFPTAAGYVKPLYLLPVFQKRVAFGSSGYPFSLADDLDYRKGLCPVSERMHESELVCFDICSHDLSEDILHKLGQAVRKVHEHQSELRELAGSPSYAQFAV